MFQLFAFKFEPDINFQKLQNNWVAKAIISLYILCKIWSIQIQVTESIWYIGLKFFAKVIHVMTFLYPELIYKFVARLDWKLKRLF